MQYYVYVLQDLTQPGTFEFEQYKFCYLPIYIGKGRGARVLNSMRIRSNWFGAVIAGLTEREALTLEKGMIRAFGCECNVLHNPGVRAHNSNTIHQYTLAGDYVATWESAHAAALALRGAARFHSNIAQACRHHNSAYGFVWVYSPDQVKAAIASRLERRSRRAFNATNAAAAVGVTVTCKGKLTTYRSICAAAKALGMHKQVVKQRAQHGREVGEITITLNK